MLNVLENISSDLGLIDFILLDVLGIATLCLSTYHMLHISLPSLLEMFSFCFLLNRKPRRSILELANLGSVIRLTDWGSLKAKVSYATFTGELWCEASCTVRASINNLQVSSQA